MRKQLILLSAEDAVITTLLAFCSNVFSDYHIKFKVEKTDDGNYYFEFFSPKNYNEIISYSPSAYHISNDGYIQRTLIKN